MKRAPNAQLTEAQWDAIRSAWETGSAARSLAAEFGVDESSIRNRQKKGGWVRDEAALERMQVRGQARTLLGAADPASSREGIPHPAACGTARDELTPEDRAALRDARVEAAADVIAQANLQALSKVSKLDRTFDRLTDLLDAALAKPASEDDVKAQAEALNVLLAGRGDSLMGVISTQAKLAETIQNQRRKALGMEDRPKRVEHTGPGGGPIETDTRTTVEVDYSRFTTEELELMRAAAQVVEGRKSRPPIPMPPTGPIPASGNT